MEAEELDAKEDRAPWTSAHLTRAADDRKKRSKKPAPKTRTRSAFTPSTSTSTKTLTNGDEAAVAYVSRTQYFCPYRRDLRAQRASALQTLKKHVAQLKKMHIKPPSPHELLSVANKLGIKVKDVEMLSMAFFRELYERNLNEKHAFWQKKTAALNHQWTAIQNAFAQRLVALITNKPGVGMNASRLAHLSLSDNDGNADVVDSDSDLLLDRTAATNFADQTDKPTTIAVADAQTQRAHLLTEKTLSEERLTAVYDSVQQEYHSDFVAFNAHWEAWVRTEKRYEWLEQERVREFDRYYACEQRAILAQYQQRKQEKRVAAAAATAATAAATAAQQPSQPPHSSAARQVHVTCAYNGAQFDADAKVGRATQTVAEFAHAVAVDQLKLPLTAGTHTVWAFVLGGPKMRDEMPLSTYDWAKIPELKLVVISAPALAPGVSDVSDVE